MKKIPVWKNVLLIVSVIIAIIIATFAWFYSGPRATVDDLAVHVGEATYLQISSDDGKNWSEDLELDIGINKNFKEMSGDGTSFYVPVYDVAEDANGGYSTQIVAYEKVAENVNYYEETFLFRADSEQDVYLAPESYVTAISNGGSSYIDGAIRVAFFEVDENGNEILKCIWAPNSTVEYSQDANAFTKSGNVEANYYYQRSVTPVDTGTLAEGETSPHVAKISTAGTDEANCGYNQTYKFMWSSGEKLPVNAPSLLTLQGTSGDSLDYKEMKIRVWLEGHDRECVSQLSGQKFTMKLQFNAERGE